MGPRRELQINFPAPPAIEWCLCVGVMHHSRPPLLCCPTQPLYWELSRRPARSNPSLPPLSSLTLLTCSIKQGIVALLELLFNNELGFLSAEEVRYLESPIINLGERRE